MNDDDYEKAHKALRRTFNAFLIALTILAITVVIMVVEEINR